MKDMFEGKDILVTGGCGSIGREIVKQLLKFNPTRVRVFDNNEDGHFRLNQEVKSSTTRNLIGDIRDRERVRRAMRGVDIVFHAAALKHVPFCEYNPFEAVNTNVIGTKNLVDAAISENIERFIGISTDKAVNPINTMGATKLLSEKIITNAPVGVSKTIFCCVRFGNVLNSNGSVIPIFKKQIKEGGPVTITSDKMTRFFMDMPEAVNLVLKAAEQAQRGATFILKMKTIKITDLAEVMVEEMAPKYGYKAKDIKFETIGIRPGEKISEALMTKEELDFVTELDDMFILYNSILSGYGKGKNLKRKSDLDHHDYDTGFQPLLGKKEIKKILHDKKIIT